MHGDHVPWASEVSSANDETRSREAKYSTTKIVLLALTVIMVLRSDRSWLLAAAVSMDLWVLGGLARDGYLS